MRSRFFYTSQKPLPWLVFLVLQLFCLRILRDHPEWVETHYSSRIYPLLFGVESHFFGIFPFSVGDLLYAIVIVYFIYQFFHYLKYKPHWWGWVFSNLILIVSLFHFLFYLNWGLNYFRIPLHQKMNFSLKYSEESLIKTLHYHLNQTHQLHQRLSASDSVAVLPPYSKKQLMELIQENYNVPFKAPKKCFPKGKTSLWSLPLSYAGYGGYLNPFTLESQTNSLQPPLGFVTTAAHEMAHQWGIAAEDEANFMAYYTLANHPDTYLRYAAHSFAVRYLYSDLYRLNQEAAKEIRQQMKPGLLRNFERLATFWKQFENPLEPFFKQFYHQFLKANGQKKGIKRYSDLVGFLVEH